MTVLRRLVERYLRSLSQIHAEVEQSGAGTPELSYRPVLNDFVRGCCRELRPEASVVVVYEPSSTGRGRPDFRLHESPSMGVYGYIECKALRNEPLDASDCSEQVERYCQLGYPVILTDGLEFHLFDPADPREPTVKTCIVSSKPDFFRGGIDPAVDTFQAMMTGFLQVAIPQTINTAALTQLLARRAKVLRDEVWSLVDGRFPSDSQEERLKGQLVQVYDLFHQTLDHALTAQEFSSFVAQMLVFSLLIAYRESLDHITLGSILGHLGHLGGDYPPFRALCDIVGSDTGELGVIKTAWTDAAMLLAYVCISDLARLDDYHALYREFHSQYDPDERIDFGGYATPKPLVRYMVETCREVLGSPQFEETSLFAPGVKIVDPCCGTGTYLEELAEVYAAEHGEGPLQDCVGIEVLPVPYALSQLRIAAVCRRCGISGPHVYLGNSLADEVVGENSVGLEVARDEPEHVRLLKQEFNSVIRGTRSPLMVIVGNPPVSDTGLNMGEQFRLIDEALDAFRPPEEERRARQNIQKSLQNDFVKFIRWACLKLDQHRGGVISFVVPLSSLADRSYKYMRSFLLENYDEIYVLELDRDKRRLDSTVTQSVFPTLQGRAVLTVVRRPQSDVHHRRLQALLYYLSVSGRGSRQDRLTWLEDEARSRAVLQAYCECDLLGDLKAFVPLDVSRQIAEEYVGYRPIDMIFLSKVSGVKTACTSLVVHSDRQGLIRLLGDYIKESMPDASLFRKYFARQVKTGEYVKGWSRAWRAKSIMDDGGVKESRIVPYEFRPFVKRFIYYLPSLIEQSAGGRPRPELEQAFLSTGRRVNSAVAVAQSPSLLGVDLDPFVSYVSSLPDNDLVRRGNAYIFPIWFASPDREVLVRNVRPQDLRIACEDGETPETLTDELYEERARALLFYVYAVLHSPAYLARYRDLVFHGVFEGFVRVPMSAPKSLFRRLASIGERMALAQTGETVPDPDCRANLTLPAGFREMRLSRVVLNQPTGLITLVSDSGERVQLGGIPVDVLRYTVSGYEVVQEWWKYRTFVYLHNPINSDTMEEFAVLVASIKLHIALRNEVDSLIAQLLLPD